MNKETKDFVKSLLHKYNSYQNVVDVEDLIFNNSHIVGKVDEEIIELEDIDAFSLIEELCEALNIVEVVEISVDEVGNDN